jgi:serine/threonine protein kinase
MPTRRQENARPVALGAPRVPLKIFSQAQIMAMTENFSGRRVLGQGGTGKVYRGSCEDGSESAIKILNYEGVNDETKTELMRHMAREVRFLQRVHSPFIVKLLGVQKVDPFSKSTLNSDFME